MRHLSKITKDNSVEITATYNWHVIQSIVPASLICCAGGMKWGWCVFEPQGRRFGATLLQICFVRCIWFVGMLIGALIANMCLRKLQKVFVYFISGMLVCMGAILSIILPQYFFALCASCLLEGIAYSLAVVLIYVNTSELAYAHKRAFFIINAERSALWLGILLQLLLTQVYYSGNHDQHVATRLHAICILCLSQLSLGIAYLQLRAVVLRSRILLHRSSIVQHNLNKFSLLRVLALRLYASLPLSLCYSGVYLTLSWQAFDTDLNCIYTLALAGFIGSVVGSWLIDAYGRRSIAVCGALLCSQLIFVSAGVIREVSKSQEIFTHITFQIMSIFLLCYEFLNSVGVGAASSVYATEAFCAQTKPAALAIMLGMEALLQIVLIAITMYLQFHSFIFFFILGCLSLIIGICVFIFYPETQSRSLSECVNLFRASTTAY